MSDEEREDDAELETEVFGKSKASEPFRMMWWVSDQIGDTAAKRCGALGMAIAAGSVKFDIPKVSAEDCELMSDGECQDPRITILRSRFALLGYVVRNCMLDGYSLKKNYLGSPPDREAAKSRIIDLSKLN